jgi:hypothetical protein
MSPQRGLFVGLMLLVAVGAATPATAQLQFKSIDVIPQVQFAKTVGPGSPQAMGTCALILVLNQPQQDWFVRAMTLSESDGSRMGQAMDIAIPPQDCKPPNPNRILYSMYFLPGQAIVLGDDMSMETVPITIGPDGTTQAGDPVCHPPSPNAPDLGPATALTEMPGSAFQDGMPRLFVGTQGGIIASFVMPVGAADPVMEGNFGLPDGMPIAALHPIPQMSGLLLGVAAGDAITGIVDPELLPAVQFKYVNPELMPIFDFAVGMPDANQMVPVAFCDGSVKIPLTALPFDAAGDMTLSIHPPSPNIPLLSSPPMELALGSMLMLTEDGLGVYFDPGFDISSGLTGCIADVNDPSPAVCYECAILLTGDVNLSSTLTSADIIGLVNYVFKGGAAPQPCPEAGDVNCDSKLTSADIIGLVNYVFKSGAAPCNVCEIFPPCP